MLQFEISNDEFGLFKNYIYQSAGIDLGPDKKTLIVTRLSKRLRHHGLGSFSEYFNLMMGPKASAEQQIVVDLLTTNETYFFREPKHFSFLETEILSNWHSSKTFRVWSAASSTGEEAYSIAMVLDDRLGVRPWQVLGSDISTRVLEVARKGHYIQNRIDAIPKDYLKRYCLKGVDDQAGTMLIDKKLRDNVSFEYMNLKRPTADVGMFNVIFLRNVLIYFDLPTKKYIVKQLVEKLLKGGYFFIGHSETLNGIDSQLNSVGPAVYQKP